MGKPKAIWGRVGVLLRGKALTHEYATLYIYYYLLLIIARNMFVLVPLNSVQKYKEVWV